MNAPAHGARFIHMTCTNTTYQNTITANCHFRASFASW